MSWVDEILTSTPDGERKLVAKYSDGLLSLARDQLPARIQPRVDPEDIVQSVYRSFFRRMNEDEFSFEESHDVWRLLAVMTYHKVYNVVKHHRRLQRDFSRDVPLDASGSQAPQQIADVKADAEHLAIMVECLEGILAELPADHRPIVVMRLEGYSIAEIAEEVKLSERSVLRILARLREFVQLNWSQ